MDAEEDHNFKSWVSTNRFLLNLFVLTMTLAFMVFERMITIKTQSCINAVELFFDAHLTIKLCHAIFFSEYFESALKMKKKWIYLSW